MVNNTHYLRQLDHRTLHSYKVCFGSSTKRTTKAAILKSLPIPEILHLKLYTQVMVPFNVDVDQKLANGTKGVVIGFHRPSKFPIVKFQHVTRVIRPVKWYVRPKVYICCIPLIVAYSTTIHKSQGASIDYLHVNLRGAFAQHQVYVALSRATKSTHLSIEGWDPTAVRVSEKVKQFYISSS